MANLVCVKYPEETYGINNINRLQDFNLKFEKIKDNKLPDHLNYFYPFDYDLCGGKRFYISDRKYCIFEGANKWTSYGQRPDMIGVELIELSSKKVYYFNVYNLLVKRDGFKTDDIFDKNKMTFKGSGPINKFLENRVANVNPYITIIELVDLFINYVGNRHIYFDMTSLYIDGRDGKRRSHSILNAHFVKDLGIY
jgi:hypothetical protein